MPYRPKQVAVKSVTPSSVVAKIPVAVVYAVKHVVVTKEVRYVRAEHAEDEPPLRRRVVFFGVPYRAYVICGSTYQNAP
jgi:hypothetical protein